MIFVDSTFPLFMGNFLSLCLWGQFVISLCGSLWFEDTNYSDVALTLWPFISRTFFTMSGTTTIANTYSADLCYCFRSPEVSNRVIAFARVLIFSAFLYLCEFPFHLILHFLSFQLILFMQYLFYSWSPLKKCKLVARVLLLLVWSILFHLFF